MTVISCSYAHICISNTHKHTHTCLKKYIRQEKKSKQKKDMHMNMPACAHAIIIQSVIQLQQLHKNNAVKLNDEGGQNHYKKKKKSAKNMKKLLKKKKQKQVVEEEENLHNFWDKCQIVM